MHETDHTPIELLNELQTLRQRVADLEQQLYTASLQRTPKTLDLPESYNPESDDLDSRALASEWANRHQQAQVSRILASMTDAVFALDQNWCFTYANQRFEDIIQRSFETIAGRCIWEVFPEAVGSPFYVDYHRAIAQQVSVIVEAPQPDNSGRWLEAHAYPTPDGLVVFFRDITDRKVIEQERDRLLEQERLARLEAETERKRLYEILMQLPSMIAIVTGAEHRFEFANPTYLKVTGRSPDIIGQRFCDVFSEIPETSYCEILDQIYRSGEPFIWDERQVQWDRNGDGILEEAFFNCVFPALRDSQGQIQGVLMHGTEVTAQVHTRQQIEELVHHLQQKDSALRDSEERLRVAIKNSPLAVFNQDLDLRYTWIYNPTSGYSPEEVLGRCDADLVPAEDAAMLTRMKRQVIETEVGIREEVKLTVGGKIEYYDLTIEPLRDRSHQIIGVTCAVVDISARKHAEAEREDLLQREQQARAAAEAIQHQLTTIFETSPIGIGFLDHEQRFVAINAALAEINGLSRDEHLGHTISELFTQSDPALVARFQHIYETGEAFIASQFAVTVPGRSDRRPGYYNVYYLPTIVPAHPVEGLLIYVIDVTEQVRLERAQLYLAEASTVLASSLDYETTLECVAQLTVPELADWCVVHIKGDDGTVERLSVAHVDPAKVDWAMRLQEKYPFNPNEPRGAALSLRTGQSDLLSHIPDELLVQAAQDDEHLEILRQVGFQSVMTVPLRTQSEILGVISFVSAESGRQYDHKDLRLAEELARRASLAIDNARLYRAAQRDRAQAESANRIKDEFLAVLSHELRTPLNPILGWTNLLRTRPFNATMMQRALETIERNARLQTQLIEDLLDISRILQGKLRLNITTVDLATTLTAALETVHLSAEAKAIEMHTAIAPDIGPVLGDASRLQQVLWNVLSNAIKFTPQGGRVEIRLEKSTDSRLTSHSPTSMNRFGAAGTACAQITITDSGRGISPDFLPFIFDAFRQADGKITRQFGGLGLGLSIARHLVELHGGSICADSPGEGQGATFTIKLPLRITSPKPTQTPMQAAESLDLDGVQVLAVDDDVDSLELLAFILEQAGAKVTSVKSAADALLVLDDTPVDILLSDIGMPSVDGYTLVRQLRSRPPDRGGQIPAIALTAYAAEYDQQQAIAAGFQLHLAKPIEPDELIRSIMNLVLHPA